MTVRTVTRSRRSSTVTAARTLICPGPWRIEFQCPLLAIPLHLFAVQRAKEEIHRSKTGVLNEKLVGLLKGLQAQRKRLTPLVLKSGGRIVFLRVEEIDWVEAADNYVRIHVGRESHLIRETLQSLEERLNPEQFLRIHRSTLVNLDRIRELQPIFHGDYLVKLNDGAELTLSRSYREKLLEPLSPFF